jgi:ABC-type Na+ efflux pump permease subunit
MEGTIASSRSIHRSDKVTRVMIGPVFNREAVVAPKRSKTYLARSIYVLSLFVLLCTGYLVLAGTRSLTAASDLARFGSGMFGLLAPLQLIVLSCQAAVGASSSVAQEKDRRTLLLLLMTRLSGREVVVGKLAASLLGTLSLLLSGLPLFLTLPLFGGVSIGQVASVYGVTIATIVLSATVGTVVGLWREKTFQAIAFTVLLLLLYVVGCELVAGQREFAVPQGVLFLSPIRAMAAALSPFEMSHSALSSGATIYTIATLCLSVLIAIYGIARVRVWNPSREVRIKAPEPETGEEALALSESVGGDVSEGPAAVTWKAREPKSVWTNPVLWREVCTWAYGRKIVVVRLAFLALFCVAAATIYASVQSGDAMRRFDATQATLPPVTLPLAAIGVISLVLVNALAVNSLTGERDGLALDLLMVTDLSPGEFVFGKLIGVLYVTKEMILLPMLLLLYLGFSGVMTWENTVFAVIGAIQLYLFVTMLGIHSGIHYIAGRTATLVSLGTVFFLCVGIAICMVIMVSFRGAFQLQLAPFLAMILGGGAALFAALGSRNPSSAIFASSFLLPLVTFYAITQFLLQRDHLFVLVTILAGYGFTTAAMLIPALSEFDVSLDRERGGVGGENA